MGVDFKKIKNDFPILKRKINGYPLIYFDNAATTQKPNVVIKKINEYYKKNNSNVHRGAHYLSYKATEEIESSRIEVQKFINAKTEKEIIFTSGVTESINLVANCFEKIIKKGEEVIITEMEHHSNIVPWHLLKENKKIKIKYIKINRNGDLVLNDLDKLITKKTKIIALSHVSNTLGTINSIKKVIQVAKKKNIPVLIDGAQAPGHIKIDVQKLDCDFYCFSGHKMFGPTGIGVLYGKKMWLDKMQPYKGGGEMIKKVTMNKVSFAESPHKFEAGTPNICGAIGLKEAINYINDIEIKNIKEYESELLLYAVKQMSKIKEVQFIGESSKKAPIVSFILKGCHNYDVGQMLDNFGIAVRVGHHCTQPIMESMGINGTIRASFSLYNDKKEIDYFCQKIKKIINLLR